MASGRILKSQISLSEQVNDLSLHSALLFTWMITHADDFGRMRGSSRKVKAQVVPMRDDFTAAKVEECLQEIAGANLIQRYEIEGDFYIQFPSWEDHQAGLHKRTKSKFPDYVENTFPGNSGKFRAELEQNRTEQNRTEQEQEQEQKKNADALTPPKKPTQKTTDQILSSFGIEGDLARDFKKHRRSKKAEITETAMTGFQREAAKAGISIQDSVRIATEKGWVAFDSSWNWQGAPRASPTSTAQARRDNNIAVLQGFINGD
jgi:hypothetical protein